MKVYSLESEAVDSDVRVKITETKEVVSFVSVSDLKRQVEQMDNEIEQTKVRRDEIVDQIIEIDADESIKLTIKDIPAKFSVSEVTLTK